MPPPSFPIPTVVWQPDRPGRDFPGRIRIIDQTVLPQKLTFRDIRSLPALRTAIRQLQVRGAPAIGIAAAMGLPLAVQRPGRDTRQLLATVEQAAAFLATARPTAVNLFGALQRMLAVARDLRERTPDDFRKLLLREAQTILDEDLAMCRAIGRHGYRLLRNVRAVLTHCNAGGLATSGYGTALAPVYTAAERGRPIRVFADETRPLWQGARLTAWELAHGGVDTTLICDSTAAVVMREKRIGAVLVGADRIAANGDTANKIGTYALAVLARAHGIPFYVLAPSSTFDPATADGGKIPIEQRAAEEITHYAGRRIAPRGIGVYAPAFDITPAVLISAIVTERGVIRKTGRRRTFNLERA